jgi:hypothetical protein
MNDHSYRSLAGRLIGLGLFLIGAVGGIPPCAKGATFTGSAISFDGKTTVPASFLYDTGNISNATILSQATAVALGLGTLNGAGVFTPNNDPATGMAPPAGTLNKGAITGFIYQGLKISATGSDGKPCTYGQNIFVVRDQVGANAAIATRNILNVFWINAMKGAIFGGGTNAVAFWPKNPPAAEAPAIRLLDDNPTSDARETFNFNLGGNKGTSNTLRMVYGSDEDLTIIPLAEAQALDLTLSQVPVDLSVLHPDGFASLSVDNLDEDGQTMFFEAVLPSLDDAYGLAAPQTNLTVLVSDNANSEFGVLGADALGEYAYYSRLDPSNPDGSGEDEFLAAAPVYEPSTLLLLGTCLALLIFRGSRTLHVFGHGSKYELSPSLKFGRTECIQLPFFKSGLPTRTVFSTPLTSKITMAF